MRKIGIVLSLLAAIAPAAALAQNGSGVRIRITYYEPGQVIVGEFVEYCDGSSVWNGYPTEHSVYQQYDC
jgi:hypothetical protein